MKNIIVVCCDSLRGDHIDNDVTPNLLRIARDGVYYNEAHSLGSITQLSMPWLLCGEEFFKTKNSLQIKLKQYGYKTKLVTTNYLPVYKDFRAGFDESIYEPRFKNKNANNLKRRIGWFLDEYAPFWLRRMAHKIYTKTFDIPLGYIPADQVFTLAETMLESDTFMWIHLMDSHIPYRPLRHGYDQDEIAFVNQKLLNAVWLKGDLHESEQAFVKKLYRENIIEMDHDIGEFYDKVKNDSVFIVLADHGDEHGEEPGWYGHHGERVNRVLRHVPLIIVNHGKHGVIGDKLMLDLFPHMVIQLAMKEARLG